MKYTGWVREQVQGHVEANPLSQLMMDGMHLKIDRFQTVEHTFPADQAPVGTHPGSRVLFGFAHQGANHIDAAQTRFAGGRIGVSGREKCGINNLGIEILATLNRPLTRHRAIAFLPHNGRRTATAIACSSRSVAHHNSSLARLCWSHSCVLKQAMRHSSGKPRYWIST